MHLQIYSGLSLIFAILREFKVAGANTVFFYPIGQKKVTLGPLFGSKNIKIVLVLQKLFCKSSVF